MPVTTLADLGVDASARVARVEGAPALRRRLLEMGVLPGTVLRVVRVAPLGDPLVVRLRGYELSLRHDDARAVAVEKLA
ncbi:MAG: ferrous iron transport protein A [Sandaracinus sp.]